MRNLFTAYRALALIVGVLLTVLVFVAMPLKYLPADGTSLQVTGEHLTSFVGIAHGWIYMAYLVVSFALVPTPQVAGVVHRASCCWQGSSRS